MAITITDYSTFVNEAHIKKIELEAQNGVVYIIDKVLIPAQKPVLVPDVIQEQENLKTFAKAMEYLELVSQLSNTGPFTVFTPTDNAFEAVGINLDNLSEVADLGNMLNYHIVGDSILFDPSLPKRYQTLEGNKIEVVISTEGDKIINGSAMVVKELMADNGIIYIVNEILRPKRVSVTDAASAKKVLSDAYSFLGGCTDLNDDGKDDYGIDFLSAVYFLTEVASDNAKPTTGQYANIDELRITSTDSIIQDIWLMGYDINHLTNEILDQVPALTDLSETEKALLLGQARFLRAYTYFNLVQLFSRVPLVTDPRDTYKDVLQAHPEEIYNYIIEDLQFAETTLPAHSSNYKPSRYAASAILARVYLRGLRWQDALDKTGEIINSGYFTLNGEYSTAFSNPNDSETIWRIYIDATETSSNVCFSKLKSMFAQTHTSGYDFRDEYLLHHIIIKERRAELAFEGQRWYDVARDDMAMNAMYNHNPNFQEHKKIFPIPQIVIDLNPDLVQNPGY